MQKLIEIKFNYKTTLYFRQNITKHKKAPSQELFGLCDIINKLFFEDAVYYFFNLIDISFQ